MPIPKLLQSPLRALGEVRRTETKPTEHEIEPSSIPDPARIVSASSASRLPSAPVPGAARP